MAPLLFRDRILGTMTALNYANGARLGEQEVELLTAMANQIAVAIENARLFQEEQERLAELAIINSVQSALAAELNIQGIYDTVGNKIRELFHQADVGIRIFDPQTNLIHYPFCYENGLRINIESATLPEKGFASHVLNTHETLLIVENMEKQVENFGSFILPGTDTPKSALFVPLIVGDQARGLIDIVDMDHEKAFTESDVRLLQTLANSMSVALENARLFDETQRRARETAALAEVGRDISATLDLNTVMERIAAHAMGLLQGDSSAIYLPDASGKTFHAFVAVGVEAEIILKDVIEIGEGIIGSLAQSGKAEFVNDTLADPRVVAISGTEIQAEERLMIAPLMAGTNVTGMMAVWRVGGSPFIQEELEFLISLSRQAAVAIENARLFDESQRSVKEAKQRAAELATVNRISQAVVTQLDTQALIQLAGEQIRAAFDADIAYIATLDREAGLIHFQYHYGETFETLQLGEGLVSKIIQSGEPLLINKDVGERTTAIGATVVGIEARSYIGVPILAGRDAIGAISVQSLSEEGRFTENDVHLLATIAANLGSAIANARLYEEAQRTAQEQAATSDILNIINGTLGETQPVLDAIAKKATELCQADGADISQVLDGLWHEVAAYGIFPKQMGKGGVPVQCNTVAGSILFRQTGPAHSGYPDRTGRTLRSCEGCQPGIRHSHHPGNPANQPGRLHRRDDLTPGRNSTL